jgi:hypothetical protein
VTIQSKPFYWLECDEPGCGCSSTEGSDYAAWAQVDGAEEEALASEWTFVAEPGERTLHYCRDHAPRPEEDSE